MSAEKEIAEQLLKSAHREGSPVNLSLVVGVLSLLLWIALVFVLHVGAGWPHLFLAAGVILLIRRVVTGRSAW